MSETARPPYGVREKTFCGNTIAVVDCDQIKKNDQFFAFLKEDRTDMPPKLKMLDLRDGEFAKVDWILLRSQTEGTKKT